MRPWLPFIALGVLLVAAVTAGRQMKKRSGAFDKHAHPGMEHAHDHAHVTHNRHEDANVAEWEHLTSQHGHSHNHPALEHAHVAHKDVEHEHLGEAHIHDHAHPTVS